MRRFKNNKQTSDTWCGQVIAPAQYYTILETELPRWRTDIKVLADLSVGSGLMEDGVADYTDYAAGINFLIGNVVEITKQSEAQPFAQPTYRTKRYATDALVSVAAGADAESLFFLPSELYTIGGSIIIENAAIGDYITAEVSDPNGVIPAPYRAALCESWPSVASYVIRQWVEVDGAGPYTTMVLNTYPLSAKISAGLALSVRYYAANTGSTRKFGVNYYLTKKL